jgi:hypothetical protein
MKQSLFFTVDASVLCLILFVACVLMVIVGKRIRSKLLKTDEQESRGGVNSLLGALFGLWGFLLAFTFGNVSTRFENVRAMMAEEASLIRNVSLRLETFPDSLRDEFQNDLKKYVQARIDYYEYAEDVEKFNKTKQDAVAIGKSLWSQTINASHATGFNLAANNMLAALTAMYDIGARRDATLMSGMPAPISMMLFFIALVISFVGGFTSPDLKIKEWVVIIGFILLACLIIYVTLDMSRPMTGLIKPDAGQEKIIRLKDLF